MTAVAIGALIWAIGKAMSDSDMWRAIYQNNLDGVKDDWHITSWMQNFGVGLSGVGIGYLVWGSSKSIFLVIPYVLGVWILANLVFRIVYVRLFHKTWNFLKPEVNQTVVFVPGFKNGKFQEKSYKLEDWKEAFLFYFAQLWVGLVLIAWILIL